MSQRELQSLLDVKSSSLSEMITKMENAGLIKKTRSKKDQRVLLIAHFFTGNGADLEIKIPDGAHLLKQPGAVLILGEVQLDIVFKELLPDVADDKSLADLPRSVNDQHFVRVGFQIAFDKRLDFSV